MSPQAHPSRSDLVVSHHLAGFRRKRLAGLLHPAADPRVRYVSRTVSLDRVQGLPWSPQRVSYPPKDISPPVAVLHRCSPCPLAVRGRSVRVPVIRCRMARAGEAGVGFEALLHRRVRTPCPSLPTNTKPILPWALFPFEVPLHDRSSMLHREVQWPTRGRLHRAPFRTRFDREPRRPRVGRRQAGLQPHLAETTPREVGLWRPQRAPAGACFGLSRHAFRRAGTRIGEAPLRVGLWSPIRSGSLWG